MDQTTLTRLVLGSIFASMTILRVVQLINGHTFASLMQWNDTCKSMPPIVRTLSWAFCACLCFGPVQIATAGDPNASEKSAVQSTGQDASASERAERDAAGLLTIEGTVVDERGNPVSNVRVRLQAPAARARVSTSLSDSQGRFRFLSAKDPDLVRWATTDSQGRYHFRVGPGTFELWAPEREQRIPLTIDSQPEVVQDFREGQ